MRQFVIVAHDVPTDGEFSLDDLPGGGRVDVCARCLTAAFVRSHALREDVRAWLVIDDAFAIRFEGSGLQGLNPDERSTAALIRGALDAREGAIGHMEAESSPGVYISRRDLADVLEKIGEEGTILTLHEEGTPLVEREPPSDPAFVLSDHHSFTERETELLAEHADAQVSVGPETLHADHAITVAHNWLDTDGFARY